MGQHQLIVDWMREHGSISPMEAFEHLGITKLSTRISELIRLGVKIIKTRVEGVNRFGQPVHYMTYRLAEAA